jgi:redox-sensitive bicupin YhaK (pirin superfamily)
MTAGAGVLHKEYHEAGFSRRGGNMHFVQLWTNLPRAQKMTPPTYQELLKSQMGRVALPGGGEVRIVAGELSGVKGPARTFTPMNVWHVLLAPGERAVLPVPSTHNTMLLSMSPLSVVGRPVPASRLVVFENDGGQVELQAPTDAPTDGQTQALVLSGEPIHEPVVAAGPFVMNTEAEIRQAFLDVRLGRFGHLE